MPRNLMLLLSLACRASCVYCFGPQDGTSPMSPNTVEAVVRWLGTPDGHQPVDITCQDGEPMTHA